MSFFKFGVSDKGATIRVLDDLPSGIKWYTQEEIERLKANGAVYDPDNPKSQSGDCPFCRAGIPLRTR